MPKFSVIIPTYNRATLLREALDSVFAQKFTDYEVIVVDDGSTDETAAVVDSYGGRIRYFQQKNQGPGAARNWGVNSADGEYIAFLDSDDLWFPWTLETMSEVIKQQKCPSFIAGNAVEFTECNTLEQARRKPISITEFKSYIESASKQLWCLTSGVAIRRDEFSRVGGFTDRNINGEDSDLWLRLGMSNGFIHIKTPMLTGYRLQKISAVANLEKTYSGMIHIIMSESKGVYPGGQARAMERRKIITRHVRPASLNLAKCGAHRQAIDLYKKTLCWHVSSGRIKYLFGFWLVLFKQLTTHSQG